MIAAIVAAAGLWSDGWETPFMALIEVLSMPTTGVALEDLRIERGVSGAEMCEGLISTLVDEAFNFDFPRLNTELAALRANV